ncbi:uncharacterized protein CXorf66 homolog [Odocoileus virginianus]|uniref:Uncharacterized protein CXorf66 homolog n=1 Tax=Odocoileus virginianus TaxID=9874 RepID=A0A6J0XU32_ODOVR|nr:uncharacterized protein CXorf66 homolog [Odocoileus virginianus texanus]
MNLFIYVLLLSIWTNNCLNRNESNGSAIAVTTQAESKQSKLEELRRHILIIVAGILIISYMVTCSCFLYYTCDGQEAHKAAKVNKGDITIKASTSSKISFTGSKSPTAGLGDPEKQFLISSTDKSFGPSSPQKASVPSSAKKSVRRSSQQNPSKPSNPKKVLGSPQQEKLHRTRSPKQAHRWAHAHKLVGQVSPSYPKKATKPTWSSSLQCQVKPTKTPLPYSKNQSFPEQSSVEKLTKRQRYVKPKCPTSAGKAEILSRPQPVKFCRCYKEKCLVCRAVSEPFITHISEANIKHVPVPLFSRELKHFYKSYKKRPRYTVLYGNTSGSDVTTYNSDGDSDREVIILCDIKSKEDIYKNSQYN